jgi:hypothetical protein
LEHVRHKTVDRLIISGRIPSTDAGQLIAREQVNDAGATDAGSKDLRRYGYGWVVQLDPDA